MIANHAFDSQLQKIDVEVDEKSKPKSRRCEIRQQLAMVHFGQLVNGLQFEDQAFCDEQVDATGADRLTFVHHLDRNLAFACDSERSKLDAQCALITLF